MTTVRRSKHTAPPTWYDANFVLRAADPKAGNRELSRRRDIVRRFRVRRGVAR